MNAFATFSNPGMYSFPIASSSTESSTLAPPCPRKHRMSELLTPPDEDRKRPRTGTYSPSPTSSTSLTSGFSDVQFSLPPLSNATLDLAETAQLGLGTFGAVVVGIPPTPRTTPPSSVESQTVAPGDVFAPLSSTPFVVPSAPSTNSLPPPPPLVTSCEVITASSCRQDFLTAGMIGVSLLALRTIWPDIESTDNDIQLKFFIEKVLYRSRTRISTLQVALYYLARARRQFADALRTPRGATTSDSDSSCQQHSNLGTKPSEVPSTSTQQSYPSFPQHSAVDRDLISPLQCGRRSFVAAVMLAWKSVEETTYSGASWSKLMGLSAAEISRNEKALLVALDYRLHVDADAFDRWSRRLYNFASSPSHNVLAAYADIPVTPPVVTNVVYPVVVSPVRRFAGSVLLKDGQLMTPDTDSEEFDLEEEEEEEEYDEDEEEDQEGEEENYRTVALGVEGYYQGRSFRMAGF
ncbi:hypothetical protein T439DRAFT_323684 [Meredithblackwellia eburnea MCA 4105]